MYNFLIWAFFPDELVPSSCEVFNLEIASLQKVQKKKKLRRMGERQDKYKCSYVNATNE